MTAFPCFANCGKPACQKLGCIRVYNDRNLPPLVDIEAPSLIDGWGERLDTEALDAALEAAPQGSDWWFDGRDLFYKPEGTNLDQIIVPFPETWHESQEVPQAVGHLIATAVNYLRAVRRGN